jgi:hypothetical protein
MIIQGRRAITGDDKMVCRIFGETITFAPQIKNWWQAVALGASNYIGGILEGAMYGAGIGATGGLLSGGPAVLAEFGASNIAANWLATWGGWGLGLRGLTTAQSVLGAYGNRGEVGFGDVVTHGVFGMESGTLHAMQNIASGNGTMTDVLGVALWFTPAGRANEEARGRGEEVRGEEARGEETRGEETQNEENPQARANEGEAPAQQGEHEAYEAEPAAVPESAMRGRKPALPEYPVLDAEGRLTEYGQWYYGRPGGYREGVRQDAWDAAAAESIDGVVRDPLTGEPLNPNERWDMGHKPGYEFRKHQLSAARRGIGREQFLDEHNTPDHYRPEDPISNSGHQGEAPDGVYYGP